MIRIGMKKIELNPFANSLLTKANWFVEKERYKSVNLTCAKEMGNSERWLSDDYLKHIMGEGTKHDGYPEVILGHSLGINNLSFAHREDNIIEKAKLITERLYQVNTLLQTNLMMRKNALFCIYPPGGFISWHNNANAPAYNVIFTWSETGDGWFKYFDQSKKEIIKMQDQAGWQCKVGYFGPYNSDPRALLYHSAYTNCLRMTIAFTLSKNELGLGVQNWLIDDISSYNPSLAKAFI